MAGLLSTIKIGPPGAEISIVSADYVTGLRLQLDSARSDTRTLIRETTASLQRRHLGEAILTLDAVPEATALGLASLNGIADQELAFVFANDWLIKSESYVLETTTTFTMKSSSFLLLDKAYNQLTPAGARQVKLVGVYDDLVLVGSHTASNRVGSPVEDKLNRTTWVVTLTTAGTAGNKVYVDYTVTGLLGLLASPVEIAQQHVFDPQTGSPLYSLSLRIVGA